jgi:hypothetical protein
LSRLSRANAFYLAHFGHRCLIQVFQGAKRIKQVPA